MLTDLIMLTILPSCLGVLQHPGMHKKLCAQTHAWSCTRTKCHLVLYAGNCHMKGFYMHHKGCINDLACATAQVPCKNRRIGCVVGQTRKCSLMHLKL